MTESEQQRIYGMHAVQTVLEHFPKKIIKLYLLAQTDAHRWQTILALAEQHKLEIIFCSRQELDKLVEGNHQGIIAECKANSQLHYSEADLIHLLDKLTTPAFLLILDGVQDPHNLGACLRSANAAGVHAVIAPKDRAVGLTPVARKVASGAAEFTPFIQVTNLARTMRMLQERGIWLYGAAEEGTANLYQVDLTGAIALVLGAEGSGLRRLTREHCDLLLSIPTQGIISSLNVSVATGVCLFEAVRQRSINAR